MSVRWAFVLAAFALVSCEPADQGGPVEGGLKVRAAPLTLGPITDAVYQVTVFNDDEDVVWSRDISSSAFGDGAGAISYVGTCDPAANPNRVELVVVSLSSPSGPLSFANPAPPEDPLVELVDCLPQEDVSVSFEFTAAVAAEQGFFDVAITFDDIFCSAKFDCLNDDDEPLELLFNPLTGERDRTAVLGFACTAGPNQDTYLWMDPIEILCSGGGPFDINTAGGPGNLDPYFPGPLPDTERLLFQAAVYRGVELLDDTTSWNKGYWNVAIGLNEDAFELLDTCVLHGLASASNGDFNIGQTPPNVRWPAVQWNVPLIEAGEMTCGRYEMDASDEVKTIYTPSDGHRFYASYRVATGELEIQVGTPDASTVVVCADETLNPGEQTLCSITPRQDGLLVPVEPADFDGLSASAGSVTQVQPQELSTAFTFTFTAPPTSQVVTIDTGVGATTTVTVLGTPDNSTTLSCADSLLLSGESTVCTITPMAEGAPVAASASNFAPAASPDGTVSAIAEPHGTALHFTYTAGAATGTMTITDGAAASTTLTVYSTPDATSTVSCADDRLMPGHTTTCTIIPRRNGIQILTVASDFDVTSSPDGGIGGLSPTMGTSFTFVFTAPGTLGDKTIDVGFHDSQSQTTVEVYSNIDPEEVEPPSKPIIVDAGPGDRQIWLTWIPPIDDGGSPNLVYTVTCTAVDGNGPDGTLVTASLDAVVLWLENGKEYTCVVFATNEAGDGPPSDPTDIIIPEPAQLEPGTVVASPLTVYATSSFDGGDTDAIGVIQDAPSAFFGEGVTSPYDPSVSGAVVARPMTVYRAASYDGGGDYPVNGLQVGVIQSVPGGFLGEFATDDFALSESGSVVAPALAVYNRQRFDDAGRTQPITISVINAVVAGFLAESSADPFGEQPSGPVVASPLGVYSSDRFDGGDNVYISVLLAAPGGFLAGGFTDVFGESLSGAVVASPMTVYSSDRFAEPSATDETSVADAVPAPFVGRADDDLGDVQSGAIVAPPLAVFGSEDYLDPGITGDPGLGAIVAAPGPFENGDPPVLGPLGPPTIATVWAGDETISLTWNPPESDGGSPILSYTMTCTRTDDSETVTATVTATSGEVTGLTNDVGYTCTVHATNAGGDGPESEPTYVLVPNTTPVDSGAVVATPLSVYRADVFFTELDGVASIVATPAPFAADGFASDLGAQASGAVVAASLTVYAARTFDAEQGVEVSAVVAAPGVLADNDGFGGLSATGAVVAPSLMIGSTATFADPTTVGSEVSAIVDVPRAFSTESDMLGEIASGAVVAQPLTVYRASSFDDGTNETVSAVVDVPGPFSAVDPNDDAVLSGAVVALPLTIYPAERYVEENAEVSAVVGRPGPFGAEVDTVGVANSGPVVALPVTVYGGQTYGDVPVTSAVVGAPAPIADDGTVTDPPGPPIIVTAVGGDHVIELGWEAPAESGGIEPTALTYTVVCTDAAGPDITFETTELEATFDAQVGHDYYCTVTARNLVGEGPPSDEVGPLTPVALHERSGAVVAPSLTLYATSRYADQAPTELASVVSAPGTFGDEVSDFGEQASGPVVALPLTVNSAARFSDEAAAVSAAIAPSAAFSTYLSDGLGASASGAVVAASWSVFAADTVSGEPSTVSVAIAPTSTFTALPSAGAEPLSGPVVAVPLTVNRAATLSAEAVEISAVIAPSAAYGAATDDLGTSLSGAVVAAPLAVYNARSFADPQVFGGEYVGALTAVSPFGVGQGDHGEVVSGAVVAIPLSVYATGTYLETSDEGGAVVASPAPFADDPALLPGGETAPEIYSAQALDESIWLAWRAPEDDGGSAIVDYTVTCESTDPADSASATFATLDGAIEGLTNGYTYTCVVYANHADTSQTASFPSMPLTPGTSSNLTGAVVAPSLTVFGAERFANDGASAVGVILAAPATFDSFASDLGQQASGAVVAATLTVYAAGRFDAENGVELSAVVSPTAAFGTGASDDGESQSGAVVAAPMSVMSSDRFTAPLAGVDEEISVILAPSAVFSAPAASDLGESVTSGVVAATLTVYGTGRFVTDLDEYGAIPAAPAVWQRSLGDLGESVTSAVVAATLTVYATERYDDADPPGGPSSSPITAAPAPWIVDVVFVTDVAPDAVSRSGLVATLNLDGFPFEEVTDVVFYAPGEADPSGLVTAGSTSIDSDGRLVVPITIDPLAPRGTWQVQVATVTGATSPIAPEASQLGYVVTFTLTD